MCCQTKLDEVRTLLKHISGGYNHVAAKDLIVRKMRGYKVIQIRIYLKIQPMLLLPMHRMQMSISAA